MLDLDDLDRSVGKQTNAVNDVRPPTPLHDKLEAEGLSPVINDVGVDFAVHEECALIHAFVRQRASGLTAGVCARGNASTACNYGS
ncbi:hypothetical protein D3C72_1247450 [compost metagenome]